MRFTQKQKKILWHEVNFEPRITILEGAVRSGKSFLNNWLWLMHVNKFKNRGLKFLMTGSTISSLRRNVLDDITSFFGIDTTLNKHNEFKLFGNIVACFGTDNVNAYTAMKGFTAYGWYSNEVTEHHINSIDQAFKRCSGEGARIFWDTNPSFPQHHVKINYIDKDGERLKSGREHIKSWHFTLDDNEYLSEEYKESLKNATPAGMWYDRDILGLWVAAEGIIYKDFDYSRHVVPVDEIKGVVFKEYFAGVDWGFDHKGVIGLYGVDHDGKCYRLLEIAETEKEIDWWVREAKELYSKYGRFTFYADNARPDNISTFRKAGLRIKEANKSVVEGISHVAACFKNDRLVIVRETNANYLKEIYLYRWKESSLKEEPIKELDDSMDSERYALFTRKKRAPVVGKSKIY